MWMNSILSIGSWSSRASGSTSASPGEQDRPADALLDQDLRRAQDLLVLPFREDDPLRVLRGPCRMTTLMTSRERESIASSRRR